MEVLRELNVNVVNHDPSKTESSEFDDNNDDKLQTDEQTTKDVEWVTKTITDLCLLASEVQLKLKETEASHAREIMAAR